jgi:hypothetical protein
MSSLRLKKARVAPSAFVEFVLRRGLGRANGCAELAADPTLDAYAPSLSEFSVSDVEHLTRSARDLTLVQASALTLKEAVGIVQGVMPDGFVYWAIPTIRDTSAGYGIYVLGSDNRPHYFFVS